MKKGYNIGIVPGDGIGKDVIAATHSVLTALSGASETFTLTFFAIDVGETAIEKYGDPLPQEALDTIRRMDATLFGAAHTFPVIPRLRRGLGLYAKVVPVRALPGTGAMRQNTDLILVRENTEGLYEGGGHVDGERHVNYRVFTTKGMERIIRFCFALAVKAKRKKITLTHKAEVLKYTDGALLERFYEIAQEYPGISAEDMMVDGCAMTMIMKPEKLDVILAENANGDILSDVGAAVTGGLGLAPSGNIGDSTAVFEPVHGSAPKYAGKNIVNPIAAIMSARMLLEHIGQPAAALCLEKAVRDVLVEGRVRTYDLGGNSSTVDVADAISEKIAQERNAMA